jgi:8-amino-3,8-dideoxy-alpha-D-manno-octulosonate transaminase
MKSTPPAKDVPVAAATARPIPSPSLGSSLIGAEEEALVLAALRSKSLFRYYGADPAHPPALVATLEEEFRQLVGTRFALGVTSGSAALEVAFGALGIGPGDEVIVPAWSWVSCFTSVVRVGARPVLAEIDETLCLHPDEIDRLRTDRTKAVLVVHFQGVAADLDPILRKARRAGIAVVEDCAESPGACYRGRRVGSHGDIGIFSFQQQKSITSGEGGMVVTNESRLFERAVRMHDLGQVRLFHERQVAPVEPAFCGGQFRMSELTGAVALAQVRKLDRIRAHCRGLSARIRGAIGDHSGLVFRTIPDPTGDSGFEIYFWLPTAVQRDAFRHELQQAGIPCQQMTGTYAQYRRSYVLTGRSHAPAASPFPAGSDWPSQGYRAQDFPRTEDLIHRFIAIPVGVNYTEGDADHIGATIRRVAHKIIGRDAGGPPDA